MKEQDHFCTIDSKRINSASLLLSLGFVPL